VRCEGQSALTERANGVSTPSRNRIFRTFGARLTERERRRERSLGEEEEHELAKD